MEKLRKSFQIIKTKAEKVKNQISNQEHRKLQQN